MNDELGMNISVFYVEYLVVESRTTEYLVEMVAIGIGDEYLAETIARQQTDNLLHTTGVEFIEDVIKQQ